jgi:hypothetical protein
LVRGAVQAQKGGVHMLAFADGKAWIRTRNRLGDKSRHVCHPMAGQFRHQPAFEDVGKTPFSRAFQVIHRQQKVFERGWTFSVLRASATFQLDTRIFVAGRSKKTLRESTIVRLASSQCAAKPSIEACQRDFPRQNPAASSTKLGSGSRAMLDLLLNRTFDLFLTKTDQLL